MSEIDPSQLEGDMIPQGKYKPASELKELHENTDLDVKAVLVNTGVLALMCAITFWAITLVMHHFVDVEKGIDQEKLSLRFGADVPPPGPILQSDPAKETTEIIHSAQARLGAYGWNDRQAKTAHIPIDRAIAILAEKGLPKRGKVDEFHPRQGSSNSEKIGVPASAPAGESAAPAADAPKPETPPAPTPAPAEAEKKAETATPGSAS